MFVVSDYRGYHVNAYRPYRFNTIMKESRHPYQRQVKIVVHVLLQPTVKQSPCITPGDRQ